VDERALVIGIGNRWRGDDAAGLIVAERVAERVAEGDAEGDTERVAERVAGRPSVRVCLHEGEPIDLLGAWDGFAFAILVDTVVSGAPAGSIVRFDAAAGPLPATVRSPTSHTIGLAESIELARTLDRLPAYLTVIGIEGDRFDHGSDLTEPVHRAIDPAARAVLRSLARTNRGLDA